MPVGLQPLQPRWLRRAPETVFGQT